MDPITTHLPPNTHPTHEPSDQPPHPTHTTMHPSTPRTLQAPTHKVVQECLIFYIVYPFGRQIFGFPYLSLKLSLTLPHKGKMLWCSYFRSFIKSINLDRCGNLIEKFNFVSTPWKIIIPLTHHPPYHPQNTPSPTTNTHPSHHTPSPPPPNTTYNTIHPPHPISHQTPPPPTL